MARRVIGGSPGNVTASRAECDSDSHGPKGHQNIDGKKSAHADDAAPSIFDDLTTCAYGMECSFSEMAQRLSNNILTVAVS
jgi:hypothetical protein